MGAGAMKNLLSRLRRDESGDIDDVPGYTIMVVGTLLLIATIVFLGRGIAAHNTVQSAAWAAARDASLARSSDQAIQHGVEAANTVLDANTTCETQRTAITGNGLATGLGETGTVTATVTCTVTMADLAFPGIPGEITITKTATSPVDPYRER